MLHVGPTQSQYRDNIELFMNKLTQNFQKAFYPYENVSIDKMIVKYEGHWKNLQYNAAKPSKYHIKTFGLLR